MAGHDNRRGDGSQESALEALFAAGGPLARVLPGYLPRAAQIQLAHRVEQLFRTGGVLLAEAGTGTGKTLAYLVPALLTGKKVVVSTATKTLQAQILERDVPLLSRALDRAVAAVALKGRQNYLCLRRFEASRAQARFRFTAEAAVYDRLERWAGSTETGDRAELVDLPDDFGPWREVCSTSDTCWGSRCPREETCHLLRHRRAAQKAQVVVVNHHLFFADLSVRSAGDGEVIPRYGAVVFDEAHHLEAVATHYFGVQLSSYRVADLVRSAAATAEKAPVLGPALQAVEATSAAFWAALPRGPERVRLRKALAGEARDRLASLQEALGRWEDGIAPHQAENLEAEGLYRRTRELRHDLRRFGEDPEPGEVRWTEARGRGTFLQAVPVEVGPLLSANLFTRNLPVVLTSATLRVGDRFDYLRQRLGIPPEADEVATASPFDFARRGLLYVPRELPQPADPGFPAAAAREIDRLLRASRGRAFCLFTSHRVLREVATTLRGRLPYPLLIQGEAPREVLLRRFHEEIHSVLLGAQSFWEGVDVPGESLSAVIIDKLPFASPGDPLVEARIELLRRRGHSPFSEFQLPAAAMALRQGAGRLLRRVEDRGVVAVLDRRLLEKPYGSLLRSSLPPFPLTRERGAVETFFQSSAHAGDPPSPGRG